MDTEDSMLETEDVEQHVQAELQPQVRPGSTHATHRSMTDRRQETTASEQQNPPQSANAGTAAPHDNVFAAMPQALLGTGTFRG